MCLISELVKYSNKTYEKGFVSATDGNLSVRLDRNKIAITKSGINKSDVRERDIIIVDLEDNKLEGIGNAPSELKIHLLVNNKPTKFNSAVHYHPIYTKAFASKLLDGGQF